MKFFVKKMALLSVLCITMLTTSIALATDNSSNAGEDTKLEIESTEEFKKLSIKEQERVKEIIQDEEKVKIILDELFKQEIFPSSKNLTEKSRSIEEDKESNKIVKSRKIPGIEEAYIILESSIEEETKDSNALISPFSSTTTSTARDGVTVSLYGVDILRIKGWVTYDYIYGDKVTNVQNANVYLDINYVPLSAIDISSPTGTEISRDKKEAIGVASCTYGVGFDNWNIEMVTRIFRVYGDTYGNSDSSWLKD